jgi:hypothetical protein
MNRLLQAFRCIQGRMTVLIGSRSHQREMQSLYVAHPSPQ